MSQLMSFNRWMAMVNREVTAISGLGVNDLADAPYRDMYEDDIEVEDAALEVLELSDFPMELVF